MRDEHRPHAYHRVVPDRDEMRSGRLQDAIVANPHAPPQLDATASVEPDAYGRRSREDARQLVEEAIPAPPEQTLPHGEAARSATRDSVACSISRIAGHAGYSC